jgi:hypothetical protein
VMGLLNNDDLTKLLLMEYLLYMMELLAME